MSRLCSFDTLMERDRTDVVRAISVIGVWLGHWAVTLYPSPLYNFTGGMFVAVFLILSGYGIHRSCLSHGLGGYWKRKFSRIALPLVCFVALFNLVWPEGSVEKFLTEVFYLDCTYWFIFHLFKCYLVFWLAARFMPRHMLYPLTLWAVVCLFVRIHDTHLEAEQAFSFLAGVLLSMYRDRLQHLEAKRLARWALGFFLLGLAVFSLKLIPGVRAYYGTLPYHFIQAPFRLCWGLAALWFLSTVTPLVKNRFLLWAGRHSLQIYVAHLPFIFFLLETRHSPLFFTYSLVSISLFVLFSDYLLPRISLSMGLFAVVNGFFVAKYGSRVWPAAFAWLTLGYMLLSVTLLPMFLRWLQRAARRPYLLTGLGVAGIWLMAFLQHGIDPMEVKVDRWSALAGPIRLLLTGQYPYASFTHLGGHASPFPVWQLFHLPFYGLGDVGWSFFPVFLLFLWSLYRLKGERVMWAAMVLLLVSPAVWYEVLVRSDLMTNILLLASALLWLQPRLSVEWLQRHLWGLALLVGLFGSTRLITFLPFFLLLFPWWREMHGKGKWLLPLLSLVFFLLTFVPFALAFPHDFFHSPFAPWKLQTSQWHGWEWLFFLPFLAWLLRASERLKSHFWPISSLVLFLLVAFTFLQNMWLNQQFDLFSSSYDLTYFSMALPFAVVAFASGQRN